MYIGKTLFTPEKRAGTSGCKYRNCSLFFNAIEEYGFGSFILEVLWEIENENRAELNKDLILLERNEINSCLSNIPENGYNSSDGGSGGILTPETRAKMSASRRGRQITWKDKISVSQKQYHKKHPGTNSRPRKPLSEATKKRMSEARIGKPGYWAGKKRPNAFNNQMKKLDNGNPVVVQ